MFKFLKNLTQDKNECSHKYKEIGKYSTITNDSGRKHIMAIAVSECDICGERKSNVVYEETFLSSYELTNIMHILNDRGFCSKLEFMLDNYERRKDEEERLNGESQKN